MLITVLGALNGSGRLPLCFRGPKIAPATQAGSSLYIADILFVLVFSGRRSIRDVYIKMLYAQRDGG